MTNKSKTILIDIDGCILEHLGNQNLQITTPPILLDGVIEKFTEWDKSGYKIILLTGRRESCRTITESQLSFFGIFYDQLIMGLGNGIRVLINDKKLDADFDTAIAINLNRNEGLKNINLL